MAQKMHIAIIGGGLAGASLAVTLTRLPHLDFDVYESKLEFKDLSLSVGLGPQVLRAMRASDERLLGCVYAAGGYHRKEAQRYIGEGKHKGERLADFSDQAGSPLGVMRDRWLQEMLKLVPPARLHTGKKLREITPTTAAEEEDRQPQRFTVRFEDGTCVETDAIVGADGVHSLVRRFALHDNYPDAVEPQFAGFWQAGNTVPTPVAREHFGDDFVDRNFNRATSHSGNGRYIITANAEAAAEVTIVGAGISPDDEQPKWRSPLTRDFLERVYGPDSGWGRMGRGLIECLLHQPKLPSILYQWQSSKAPTYANGMVCIMGDAAHCTTPWMGAGAGMAIEDTAVLYKLLARARTPTDIAIAFQAYSDVRLEHTQAVIDESHRQGRVACGAVGLTPKALHSAMHGKWNFIHRMDVDKLVNDAVSAFEGYKSGTTERKNMRGA